MIMLQLIEVKTLSGYCWSMHLEAIRVVGVAANIVYRCRVDHGWSMEWAGDGVSLI